MSARDNSASVGISMGSALAMILSYDRNHSILYAIVHGLCTWFYVLPGALAIEQDGDQEILPLHRNICVTII